MEAKAPWNFKDELPYLFALAFVGVALYAVALTFIPVNFDDRSQLEFAANLQNPLSVFYGRWWSEQVTYYRPIHTFLLWVSWGIFGVTWWPNQFLSLGLHLVNTLLLYRLIRFYQRDQHLAVLVAGWSMVSLYVLDTTIWVAARTSLFVATCLLLLLIHHERQNRRSEPPKTWVIIVLSVGALMGKESGIIVPLVGGFLAINWSSLKKTRVIQFGASLALVAGYLLFRVAIFDVVAVDTTYEYRPIILLGGQDLTALPPTFPNRAIGFGETVVKHIIAVIFPVFNGQGLLEAIRNLVIKAPLWIFTPLLFMQSARGRWTLLQRAGAVVIVLNAFIHFPFYGTYLVYLAHLGLCLFVGTSSSTSPLFKQRWLTYGMLISVLFVNVILSSRSIGNRIADQQREMQEWVAGKEPVGNSPDFVNLLIERYKK